MMTAAVLLEKVKAMLGITGTYQDETLQLYINETKEYLVDAGVKSDVVNSSVAVGIIARGVSDLWNYGAGNATFSEYFMQRALQLKYRDYDEETDYVHEEVEHLCDILLDSEDVSDGRSEIVYINELLYGVELNIKFSVLENWHKDMCYKIGTIENEKYWPVSDRILIGALFGNDIEAAKQNFFKIDSEGNIFVYSDLNIPAGSLVRCILSSTYM